MGYIIIVFIKLIIFFNKKLVCFKIILIFLCNVELNENKIEKIKTLEIICEENGHGEKLN